MNNFRLKAIKVREGHTFLETPFHWGPGLPVFASKESIEKEIENNTSGQASELIESGLVELYWIDERLNIEVLSMLLSADADALFLPEQYRKQVVNAKSGKQPCYFFVEKEIVRNSCGNQEMRLRQSCEAEPHENGYKYGFTLSIVLGTAIHEINLDGSLGVVDISMRVNKLLPNDVFNEST